MPSSGKIVGKLYMKRGSDLRLSPRRHWGWQPYFYNIYIKWMVFRFECCIINPEIEPIDIASLFLIGEIEISSAILQYLFTKCGAIILISIRPKLEPDKTQ